jgi:hypothetical protein
MLGEPGEPTGQMCTTTQELGNIEQTRGVEAGSMSGRFGKKKHSSPALDTRKSKFKIFDF